MRTEPTRRTTLALLALAIAAGLALRVWFVTASGLYVDEAEVLGITSLPQVGDMFRFLAAHESHPPGYYLMLRAWGVLTPGGDAAPIALSLFVGVTTIPVVYSLVSRFLRATADGLTAAWIVALSPTLIRYSVMIRPYSILALLVLLATFGMAWYSTSRQRVALLGYTISGVLLVYTHHWSWLVLAGLNLTAMGWLRPAQHPERGVRDLVVANGAIVALYLPALGSLLHQMKVAGHSFPPDTLWATLGGALLVLTGAAPLEVLILAAGIAVLWVLRHRLGSTPEDPSRQLVRLCLGTVIVTTVLAAMISPVKQMLITHCFAMLAPLLAVAVAALLAVALAPARPAALMLLAACLTVQATSIVANHHLVRSDTREVAAELSRRVRSDDLVLIFPDYVAPALAHYFMPPGRVLSYPDSGLRTLVTFENRRVRDADTSGVMLVRTQIDAIRQRAGRVWFVTWGSMPGELGRPYRALRTTLVAAFGESVCRLEGLQRRSLYEDLVIEEFARNPDPSCPRE